MPTKPLHHVSSLAFRISCLFRISRFGFRISPDPSGRIMRNEPKKNRPPKAGLHYLTPVFQPGIPPQPKNRNEPNYRTAAPLFTIHRSLFTIFTKRTQFRPPTARATTQKCETNPIHARLTTQIRKTNPIYRPSAIHELPTTNPNMRNKPNSILPRTAGVSPAFPSPITRNEPNPRHAGLNTND